MTTDVTDLVMTKYFIGEKQREVLRLTKEIDELKSKLDRKCIHPTVIKSTEDEVQAIGHRYFLTVTSCTLCGKTISQAYGREAYPC